MKLSAFKLGAFDNAILDKDSNAKNACFAKLNGEHKWHREKKENIIKKSKSFRDNKWKNFQPLEAREYRDEELKKCGGLGFLHTASGFRGSVNYRNIAPFLYGEHFTQDKQKVVNEYLITISTAFIKNTISFCDKRINKKQWDEIKNDLNNNTLLNQDVKDVLKTNRE